VQVVRQHHRALKETTINKAQFIHVIYVATTPDKLWNALIDPELTKQFVWLAAGSVEFENDIGNRAGLCEHDPALDQSAGMIRQHTGPRTARLPLQIKIPSHSQGEPGGPPPVDAIFALSTSLMPHPSLYNHPAHR
jgi:hypothetical protein